MHIHGAIALVTGANRGLGRHFTQQLLERGAAKVYATARRPELIDIPGVQTLRLDITDPASIVAAAEVATDVNLQVNNAGLKTGADLVTGDLDLIRLELDTHFWGTLRMIRAFAPQLGGGAILNVLSAMSWFNYAGTNAYGVAKAAEWNLTNGVRLELDSQGTLVTGLHLGAADTDMSADYDGDKVDPALIVRAALDGIEENRLEVVADEWSAHVKASLAGDPSRFYQLSGRP
ncbi:short-chain dehydrogenase [Paractinoplanes abujensis]|uniref:NAD(P)-dependent dehydrogenase (Short-subunit alcohol dehydrogenase family) n=1 Tax=Paractinoplanes abujensis TaxID=882441 RepID=A0A7W7CX49_9ACTN|nr:SDR family oxidoreductase [Actinoplanes abujensis]MBB4696286.1 NAD(P)-dependent dehydrogenase (short-subunit alcohol dehydrogenase family) [Actinoplanes abujensis]GID22278.1 short-chain dehydrogenase [Actinoplanes abujensis]